MIITEARRRRRSLYLLVFDGREGPTVDVRTFDESAYRVGGSITEEQLAALLETSEYNRARERALYLLGLRDYACKELEKKLLTEARAEIAAQVVERLAEVGLLDDERYAARLAQSLSRSKQYPKRRVAQELQRRGVDRETASYAAEEVDCADWKLALALIEKRYYNKMTDRESRQKVMASLARRGFSYEAIRQAMAACDENVEETEELWQ
jgi:regulatory protein